MDKSKQIFDVDLEGWNENRPKENHDGPVYNEDVDSWLWVVGLHVSNEKVRFVLVQNRTQETIKCVLDKYIKPGSLVWTDSFGAYNVYSMEGFVHQKVNHSENFTDPVTGLHIQSIERA